MFIIYILLIFGHLLVEGVSLSDERIDRPTRIVNGEEVRQGQIPWQISLQMAYSPLFRSHYCGGALVDPRWVVTAAHCVKKASVTPQSLVVVFNSINMKANDAPVASVESIIIADYNDKTKLNDLALIKLTNPVNIEGLIVPLPSSDYEANGSCIVSGWGYQKVNAGVIPNTLLAANVTILTDEECQKRFDHRKIKIFPEMLCAGGGETDACQGDSGGPLVCKGSDERYVLAGVISWGIGCATKDIPGVYTEVAKYRSWIEKHMLANNSSTN